MPHLEKPSFTLCGLYCEICKYSHIYAYTHVYTEGLEDVLFEHAYVLRLKQRQADGARQEG